MLFQPCARHLAQSYPKWNFATWPSITVENVRKYIPKSDATSKGHMNQIRQNIRSTRPAVVKPPPESDMVQEDKCNFIYAAVIDTNQIYTYLTGRFPTTSLSGNKYIVILYDNDINSILSAPMKSRGDKDMVRAFDLLIQSPIIRGLKPSLHHLENEASLALRNYLTKQGIYYQLAPPHIHRRNNAERAIQTFKNHFIARLCAVDPNFPLKLWDKLLPQAKIMLNLLRKSRNNPRMSAYAQLNGHFDLNRTPLAPPGTRVSAHEKPDQLASWDPHGVDGYYLGPALDHYRCYQVHVTKTKGTRIVDTVEFFLSKISMPHTSSKDLASIAALELYNALQNPAPAAPFSHIGTEQLQALRQLSEIFSAALTSGTAKHAPPVAPNSSQFRSTVPPGHSPQANRRMREPPVPATPNQSPQLVQHRSQRVSPSQVPSPRVTPRMNPSNVSSPRVTPTLPLADVIPLTSHPAAKNAPYVPQGMAGMYLFDTFEERHMETPALPRYNTRARARHHSAKQAQFLAPRIFRPIEFTNNQIIVVTLTQAPDPIPVANAVINQDTGASLEYLHLIQYDTTFPVWNKAAANEFGRLAQGVGDRIEGSNTIFFIPHNVVPKGKVITYGRFVVDIHPNKTETHQVRLTVGGNLIQYPGDVSTRSADLTTSGIAQSPLKAINTCVWTSITFTLVPQWTLLNTCASLSNLSLKR
jgi:hypothetical protein